MNDKPKTKWYWRLLRWGLTGIAILITVGAVIITEENWRGKRAWENYKQQAAAKGNILDRFPSSTNQIPDDQNFAKAPILTWLSVTSPDEKEAAGKHYRPGQFRMQTTRSDGSLPKNAQGNWRLGHLTDLKAWQDYYRTPPTNTANEFPVAPQAQTPGADVLLALSKFDSAVEQLREASRRPYSRFYDYNTNHYDANTPLFYLSEFKAFYTVIQLRVLAEIATGKTTNALDDIKLLLRLNDELRQEPLLLSHLVNLASMNLAIQPIYEGLAQHKWTDEQLAELQHELGRQDFLADYRPAMRGELVFFIRSMEDMRITRQYRIFDDSSGTEKIIATNFRLTPSAFFYQNELAMAQLHSEFYTPLVNLEKRIVSPSAVRNASAAMHAKKIRFYNVLALMTSSSLSSGALKFAATQSNVDLAEVACALERYRLAHDNYPESLDILAPQFIAKLPHDIINGQPFHYRRNEDGRFTLYSVGLNEKDDDGQIALTEHGSIDRDNGDVVWYYPAP